MKTAFEFAFQDLKKGLQLWRLVLTIGWDDLKQRYQRSRLGPIWMSLGAAVYISGLGVFWSIVFNLDLKTFMPFMASGLILWTHISGTMNEGLGTFKAGASLIKGLPLPLTFHVLRQSVRLMLTFLHVLPVGLAVSLYFSVDLGGTILFVIPGLALLTINTIWVTLMFGILGARFEDLSQAVRTVLPFFFFVTPILWLPEMLGQYAFIVDLNPITYFLTIVRDPLIGQMPDIFDYKVVLAITVVGWLASLALFARTRYRIPFWV